MNKYSKLGIVAETKNPPDKRTPITPETGVEFQQRFPDVQLYVQESAVRGFMESEYHNAGLNTVADVSHCDVLMGIKEVAIDKLIEGKTYFMFAHVAKKQAYNRKFLQAMMQKRITLIDYEYLTAPNGVRLVAFGRWAGVVGAYNGLRAWGLRHGTMNLKPAFLCRDREEMHTELEKINMGAVRMLVTGNGRVANGAMETFNLINVRRVSVQEYLTQRFHEPVLCVAEPQDYVAHRDGRPFVAEHFYANPHEYVSTFERYTHVTDILFACHYWDPRSPEFITADMMRSPEFHISVIADISCDIKKPIASTIRASSISEPFYDYNPETEHEAPPFSDPANITVMAVDHLPSELPREASTDFSRLLVEKVLPSLFGNDTEGIIERATIIKDGKLTPKFAYLQNFADNKE